MTKLQKDHLMILLESMDNKMQTVLETVCALNDKIDGFEARLIARIDHVVHIGWVGLAPLIKDGRTFERPGIHSHDVA